MPPERPAALFKRGVVINLPDPREGQVRNLARRGFLHVEEQVFVRCVNARDHDLQWTRNRTCRGVAVLNDGLDEDNGDVKCDECERILYPRRKEKFRRLRLSPDFGEIWRYLRSLVERVGLPVTERPGLLRVEAPGGEVHVCLVDVCPDQAVYHSAYERRDTLVFVVANDRDFAGRPPGGSKVYRLVDLLDGELAAFLKILRELARVEKPNMPLVPAVLAGPVPSLPSMAAAAAPTAKTPTLPRLPVTPDRWADLRVYMNDARTLTMCVPGAKPQHYSHDRLGMSKGKDLGPTKKWAIIEALCEGNGSCRRPLVFATFDAFKNQVAELRDIFQAVVGLNDDPFPECSNRGGLRAAFQAGPPPEDEPYVEDVYPTRG